MAAGILQRGAEALTHSSSREERAFHRALAELRRRWRVRRVPFGSIMGDLGYGSGKMQLLFMNLQVNLSLPLPLSTISAGSTHVPQTRAVFEVKKGGSQQESSSSQPTAEVNKETDILSVTIFRELRGCSEIAIFLSSSPVRSMILCVCL